VTIGARTEGAEVVLAIADCGRGLTPDQIAAIRAFTQFDRPRFEQQGMGLGFSIARSMARLWGGALEIESRLDQGTRVVITLPAACDRPQEVAA
jgi:signal transduction histidine kinase